MRRKRLFLRVCWITPFAQLAMLLHLHAADAQSETRQARHEARDQNVVFDDELLNANLVTPFGDAIFPEHVRPARVTLIRPRTSFVPELYKSVEHI